MDEYDKKIKENEDNISLLIKIKEELLYDIYKPNIIIDLLNYKFIKKEISNIINETIFDLNNNLVKNFKNIYVNYNNIISLYNIIITGKYN